jgi:hypothetical protein
MCGLHPRDSCRDILKNLHILPLQSQYIHSLLLFTVSNGDLYHAVCHIRGTNTRRNFDLFLPQSNLTSYQKGPYHSGVKLFNGLPPK